MKPKQHGLVGRRKSRKHRDNLSKAARAWHARVREALSAQPTELSATTTTTEDAAPCNPS